MDCIRKLTDYEWILKIITIVLLPVVTQAPEVEPSQTKVSPLNSLKQRASKLHLNIERYGSQLATTGNIWTLLGSR